MKIAYVEEVTDPKGVWLGVSLDPDMPFHRQYLWGQHSKAEVLERFDADAEVLDKAEFYLRYWRVFFLPRTSDPEASWATLVELAGQDPLKVTYRIRPSTQNPTGRKRNKSRLDHAMERNARIRSGQPVAMSSYTPPRTRTTKVPLSEVKTYVSKVDGKVWISPVNYAKVIGLPPQYVYQVVSKGKLRTKQGPKSKLICLEEADRYYRRKEDDDTVDVRQVTVGQPDDGSPEAGGHDTNMASAQVESSAPEGEGADGGTGRAQPDPGERVTDGSGNEAGPDQPDASGDSQHDSPAQPA